MNGNTNSVLPELKQIVGALLFGSKSPLSVEDIRRVLRQVAETYGGTAAAYAEADPEDIQRAIEELKHDFEERKTGIRIQEVAHGYRLESEPCCGLWLRMLLAKGRPARLSRPALETLAIVAYRQPCTRAEIEAVRGVAVDQILRHLLELQLIRIVGRSPLPGRPWLYGTTQKFLEHFGLKSLEDLPGIDELRRMEEEQIRRQERKAASDAATESTSSAEDRGITSEPPTENLEGALSGAERTGSRESDEMSGGTANE